MTDRHSWSLFACALCRTAFRREIIFWSITHGLDGLSPPWLSCRIAQVRIRKRSWARLELGLGEKRCL